MNERTLDALYGRALVVALSISATVACGGRADLLSEAARGDGGDAAPTGHPCRVIGRSSSTPACADFVYLDEDLAACGAMPDHTFDEQRCQEWCGRSSCYAGQDLSGRAAVVCDNSCPVEGRRPYYYARRARAAANPVGDHFAEAAELEAASVDAFCILWRELHAHGAPAPLLRRATRAAADEVIHARVQGALARRFGAAPRPAAPPNRRAPVRSLEAVAIENAIEGCVRETYGALRNRFQAVVARDAKVRAAMRRIARDETRHAALGWAVAAWAEPRLSRAARRRVVEARLEAASELARAIASEPHAELARVAGLPTAQQARALWTLVGARLRA